MESAGRPDIEPPRKRETWSIRKIAEEIGGRPIADFQDPPPRRATTSAWSAPPTRLPIALAEEPRPRPSVPAGKVPTRIGGSVVSDAGALPPVRERAGTAEATESEPDPVARVYPPLTRATARSLHGVEHEQHAETLERHRLAPPDPEPGERPHRPGPSTRPERIYLHYLLLHLDRLSDHALSYLAHAVREEIEHRDGSTPPAPRP